MENISIHKLFFPFLQNISCFYCKIFTNSAFSLTAYKATGIMIRNNSKELDKTEANQ